MKPRSFFFFFFPLFLSFSFLFFSQQDLKKMNVMCIMFPNSWRRHSIRYVCTSSLFPTDMYVKRIYTTYRITILFPSKLTPQLFSIVLLDQNLAVRVWINRQSIQRIQFARSLKHVLVDLAIIPPQTAVQLPIWETPCIHESDSMRSDLFK